MEQGTLTILCSGLAVSSLQMLLTCSVPSFLLPQQNLNGVMVAVAELLSMKIPNSYEVLFPDGPARAGLEPKKGEAEGRGE